MTELQLFWLAYAAFGGLYLQYAARVYIRRRSVLRNGISTTGRIESVQVITDSDGPDFYEPTVVYRVDRTQHRVTLYGSSDPRKYVKGKSIPLRYEAGKPQNAIASDDGWGIVWLHGFLAGGILAFGTYLLLAVYGR